MDLEDTKPAPVPEPHLFDNDKLQLNAPYRLLSVSGVDILPSKQALALTLEFSVPQGPHPQEPLTFVLSLPAAALMVNQLRMAVDECMYQIY